MASAVGPMLLRYIYHETKDNAIYGRGTMFIFGSLLYVIATFCAYMLPEDKANSNYRRDESKKRSSLVGVGYGTTEL